MKKYKFKRLLSIASVCVLFSLSVSSTALAFDGPTHEYVTKKGTELINSIDNGTYSNFYNSDVETKLVKCCTLPDSDETYGGYRWHFYNIATGSNYAGEPTCALSKFKEHYDSAIQNYKQNNLDKSYEELARSLHFLEDLNTPVHTNNQITSDAVLNFPLHISFEKHCVKTQSDYVANMGINEYGYYRNNSLDTIGIKSAMLANDNFYLLNSNICSMTKVAENSIINAQKAVSGMLYRFYNDIN